MLSRSGRRGVKGRHVARGGERGSKYMADLCSSTRKKRNVQAIRKEEGRARH